MEDEYIENLLKQIHFLGLEIKLLYLNAKLFHFISEFIRLEKKNKMRIKEE